MTNYYIRLDKPSPDGGEFWKEWGKGLTDNLAEAHHYSEEEVTKYNIRELGFITLVPIDGTVGIDIT